MERIMYVGFVGPRKVSTLLASMQWKNWSPSTCMNVLCQSLKFQNIFWAAIEAYLYSHVLHIYFRFVSVDIRMLRQLCSLAKPLNRTSESAPGPLPQLQSFYFLAWNARWLYPTRETISMYRNLFLIFHFYVLELRFFTFLWPSN